MINLSFTQMINTEQLIEIYNRNQPNVQRDKLSLIDFLSFM